VKTRGGFFIFAGVGSAALLIVAIFVIGRPKSLLDNATQAAYTGDWKSARTPRWSQVPFCWIGPSEVLYAGAQEGDRLRLMRKRIDLPDATPAALPITVPISAINWRLSPDGRRLCWSEWKPVQRTASGKPAHNVCTIVSLDGKSAVSFKTDSGHAVWTADSSSVLTTFQPTISSLQENEIGTGKSRELHVPQTRLRHVWELAPQVVYAYPDGRALVAERGPGFFRSPVDREPTAYNTNKLLFTEYDLSRSPITAKQWTVPTPPNAEFGVSIISPQGDKLFWQASRIVVSPADLFLQRVVRGYRARSTLSVRLLVSDLHGGGMHTIAEYQTAGPRPIPRFSGACWTPDGKKISFVLNNRLYTLPAE
jgi:hypothetical protein